MKGIGECLYTAQGVLMCKKQKIVMETFEAAPCTIMKSQECKVDTDCRDLTMSCRIMPVSVNATTKACMPDDEQNVTRVVVPY